MPDKATKHILLTGGGTAGHVSPHLALIPLLKERGYQLSYVGSHKGIERNLIADTGLDYYPIATGKLRRYLSKENVKDVGRVFKGFFEARKLIKKLKPDLVFSKGGFVAVPVVFAAGFSKIPVVAHESDLSPGLANKLCAPFVRRFACTFPECTETLGQKAVTTGTPLRPALFEGDRAKGLKLAGFDGQKPVLIMMGGSQGAQSVNAVLREALPQLLPQFDVLHLCGAGNLDETLEDTPGYKQLAFLTDELPDALAAADYVLSRAGSNALSEFAALQKPMLLVPLPRSASRGDQILNAESYRKKGLALVLPQEQLTADSLVSQLNTLMAEKDAIIARYQDMPPADGTQAVLSLILEALGDDKPHA